MSRLLHRLGRSTAAHPWRTISAWLLRRRRRLRASPAASAAPPRTTGTSPTPAPRSASTSCASTRPAPATPAPGSSCTTGTAHRSTAAVTAPLTQRLEAMDHVVSVSAAADSAPTGDTALLTVQYDAPVTDHDLYENLAPLDKAVDPTRDAGIQVELGGDLPDTAAAPMRGSGELIGIVAALLILVLAFGSVVGAGLPIAVALVGLGRRLGRHHPARRHDGRQHRGPDGGHDGRPGRRHRLRPAAGHPVRRVPAAGLDKRRGRRTRRRHGRTLGGVRLGDRAGLAAGSQAGRAADVRRLRLRHRDRRRRRRLGRAHPGARPVRPGRSPAAAAPGAQGPRRARAAR